MAASSLLALIDDIASLLDDIALMSKTAAKQTAGVLGDDLALNAQQVAGVNADRELPIVWAVAKGSLINKAILLPLALAISAILPWLVMPLLMVGGAYLCYEGFEKLAHRFFSRHDAGKARHDQALPAPTAVASDIAALERAKIKGAIRTDFILSAEIIVIALGTVASAPFAQQVLVMLLVAVIMTSGVYGVVALIVKLDDAGLILSRIPGENTARKALRAIGTLVLSAAPYLMKALSIIGTVAMFMVGGGIITHGIHSAHALMQSWSHATGTLPLLGGALAAVIPLLLNIAAGLIIGALVLAGMRALTRLRALLKTASKDLRG